MVVNVDIDQLKNLAREIDEYIGAHRRNMNALNAYLSSVQGQVSGAEFDVFKQKWVQIYGSASTSEKMLGCLRSYASFLRSCAEYYDRIQQNAYNRYSWL